MESNKLNAARIKLILKSASSLIFTIGVAFMSHAQEMKKAPLQPAQIIEETLRRGLELRQLVEEALERNPEIIAAKNHWEAAKQEIPQASSLDDPVLTYGYFGSRVETRVGPQRNRLGISQKFPFFGKLSLKGEIASKKAEEARELYEAKKLEIVSKVKSAYHQLFLTHKAILINQENVEILRRLARIAEIKYATGKVSQQDVLKAQVELSGLANELITLKQEKETVEAALNVLLNRPPGAPLGAPGEPESPALRHTLSELQQLAVERQPILKAVAAATERSQAALALAQRQYYPDFTVGVDYIEVKGGTTLSRDDGKDSWLFGVRLNIPLWTGKLNAGVQEAVEEISRDRAKHEAIRNKILFDVKDLFVKIETASRLVDLFKTALLPLAEQSLEAATIGYQADKVDFLNLLESQRKLQNFQLGYYRALVDYEQRLADLERAVGFELVSP